jgi:hypothetical protein
MEKNFDIYLLNYEYEHELGLQYDKEGNLVLNDVSIVPDYTKPRTAKVSPRGISFSTGKLDMGMIVNNQNKSIVFSVYDKKRLELDSDGILTGWTDDKLVTNDLVKDFTLGSGKGLELHHVGVLSTESTSKTSYHLNGITYLGSSDLELNMKPDFQEAAFKLTNKNGSTENVIAKFSNDETVFSLGISSLRFKNSALEINGSDNEVLRFRSSGGIEIDGVEAMRLSPNSVNFHRPVGIAQSIGVGTPPVNGYKLAVKGNILAKEIKVNVNEWPDYVFDEDHDRMELSELEEFVKENKHLPGIPKASVVESEGMNVSEMQVKMMEKIEELTLYMLELKAENEELKRMIQDNKNK